MPGGDGNKNTGSCSVLVSPVDDPQSPSFALRVSPLESLYYCDHCSSVRCTRCVVEEPAGYHCPNCLFDVPTASVRSEKNSCARNCFHCPQCTHVLSVVEEPSDSSGGADEGGEQHLPFSLSCSLCCWSSREIGWCFEKATGISAHVERLRAASDRTKEHAALLDHWRSVQRASASSSSSASAIHSAAAFKHRLAAAASKDTGVPEYRSPTSAAAVGDAERAQMAELMSLENADCLSRPDLLPQRIRLHMKLARRCRECHHILIKPVPKAQATQFKIQLMAANFLPAITLPTRLSLKHPPLPPPGPFVVDRVAPVVLRFANPLYTEMTVRVHQAPASSTQVHLDLPTLSFTLPPFTELWEYDEDEDEDISSSNLAGTPDQSAVVDRHANRVAIQIAVTPLAPAPNLTVPLHITCTHFDDFDAEKDSNSSAAAAAAASTQSPGRTVTNSFWVYLLLGPAH
ncbi:hypothetical protein GGI02_005285 [Coemansia sp. RSA 2322]|nr:hypothetical protein GGI02_005285 [Coemansia sp. RSA 2322]